MNVDSEDDVDDKDGQVRESRRKAQRVHGSKADKLKLSVASSLMIVSSFVDYPSLCTRIRPYCHQIDCSPGSIMVRLMRMRRLQGKVMSGCMDDELQKQIARIVGATCIGITFCWYCLHFDKEFDDRKRKRPPSDRYDMKATRGDEILLRLCNAGLPNETKS